VERNVHPTLATTKRLLSVNLNAAAFNDAQRRIKNSATTLAMNILWYHF